MTMGDNREQRDRAVRTNLAYLARDVRGTARLALRTMPDRSDRALRFGAMRRIVAMCLAALVSTCSLALGQTEVDAAIKFFAEGGAYCFRLAPEGVALSDEAEWTIMVLTSASNKEQTFRIRSVEPGATRLTGFALSAVSTAVTNVWRQDRARADFFDKFAAGIAAHSLRARIVKVGPANLVRMKTSERAEAYLKFADRGSKVTFDKAPDLSSDELLKYVDYFPD